MNRRWEWLDKEDLVKRIVSREFGRFLQYYANAPEIETPTSGKGERRKGKNSRGDQREAEAGYARLFLTVSKIDGFYAKEIIKLLNDHVRGPKVNIGRIDLMKNFSFVEVREEDADRVIQGLKGIRVKGRNVNIERAETGGDSSPNTRSERKNRRERRKEAFARPERQQKQKKTKPSREERGYTAPRGKKFKKEDWMKFLHPEQNEK